MLTPPTIRRTGFLTAVPREKGTIVMKTRGKEIVGAVASFERLVVIQAMDAVMEPRTMFQ